MFEALSRLEVAVLVGVAGAAGLVFLVRRLARRREVLVYGMVLGLTAVAYLLFGLSRGAPADHLAFELAGAVLYGALAVLGAWRWPVLLALGFTAHVAWDLFFHHASGASFAPAWYPLLCVGFDLFLGGYIAGLVTTTYRVPAR